jgi:chemotaxis protein methyltransferase CheR
MPVAARPGGRGVTQNSVDAQRALFPEREFAFSAREFREIVATLRDESGIALTESKAPLVYSRLVKRLRTLGLASFKDYCALLRSNDAGERAHMVAALTTNVTRFFREPHHFEHLSTKLLPSLLKQARDGGRVRIWSAGCASGEEPYSIAITILSLMPDAPKFDIKILATDINGEVLQYGREGAYTDDAVAPIALLQRQRWLRTGEQDGAPRWFAGDEMRALVSFKRLNLLDPWPMKGKFDVVFCRNVIIYFDEEVRSGLWPRLTDVLMPGGTLFLGHSERVSDPERVFHAAGITTYEYRPRSDPRSSPETF